MRINILGEKWTLMEKSLEQDATLEHCDGYCDWTTRTLVIRREISGSLGDMEAYIRNVKRHEIIHAFLFEAGLAESSLPAEAWAKNEEMVDWLARNIEKIYKCFTQAGAV